MKAEARGDIKIWEKNNSLKGMNFCDNLKCGVL